MISHAYVQACVLQLFWSIVPSLSDKFKGCMLTKTNPKHWELRL